jgi:hypothetical protein
MTIQQLRTVCGKQPFEPFVLHLADGGQIPVLRREFILTYPSGRTIIVVQPDDSTDIIDLLQVTDIELKNVLPALGGNGTAS